MRLDAGVTAEALLKALKARTPGNDSLPAKAPGKSSLTPALASLTDLRTACLWLGLAALARKGWMES